MGIDVNKGKSTGRGDEWYTPAWLIEALGEFDTDPAAPVQNHWTAKTCYTKRENGLRLPWNGRTFLNPPYSKIDPWIYRLTAHRNAIALVFARMDTQWMDQALCFADGVCFLTGRISFVDINGKGSKSANAPSILLAYGQNNVEAIASAIVEGKLSGRLYSETIPHDFLEAEQDTSASVLNPTEAEIERWAKEAAEEAENSRFIEWRAKEAIRAQFEFSCSVVAHGEPNDGL